jgi:hypothetical protein
MTQFSYHGPDGHKTRCYCGRKATRHVSYGSGCGNVCGIHARVIARRKRGMFHDDGPPLEPTETGT